MSKAIKLECPACGVRFRTMIAEARHRHNFPTLCTRGSRFNNFIAENEIKELCAEALGKE